MIKRQETEKHHTISNLSYYIQYMKAMCVDNNNNTTFIMYLASFAILLSSYCS